MLKSSIVQPLTGHTSPETAYVVRDYPYGFKLRCSIRYWLERSPMHGYRLCSQTTNPKKAGEVWNAPKKSTYTIFAVMGLDEKGHVVWTGCSYDELDELGEFCAKFGHAFDTHQAADCSSLMCAKAAWDARKLAAAKRHG